MELARFMNAIFLGICRWIEEKDRPDVIFVVSLASCIYFSKSFSVTHTVGLQCLPVIVAQKIEKNIFSTTSLDW